MNLFPLVFLINSILVNSIPINNLQSNQISCKDNNGNNVDNWVILKAPAGTSYLYGDVNNNIKPYENKSLNSTVDGALFYTSNQIWSQNSNQNSKQISKEIINKITDVNYILYSDQPPQYTTETDPSSVYGHSKGYIFFDNISAVWVQHSIPRFITGPLKSNKYIGLGDNAKTNAQHLYCLTINIITVNDISEMLLLIRPYIYEYQVLPGIRQQYNNINNLLNGTYNKTANVCDHKKIYSLGKVEHIVFGKTIKWNNDLWDNCISSYFHKDFQVQSWLNGNVKPLGPFCNINMSSVLNVHTFSYLHSNKLPWTWSTTVDHSKWGISIQDQTTCFGDINRVTSQYNRGGGGVCILNNNYNYIMSTSISSTDECSVTL